MIGVTVGDPNKLAFFNRIDLFPGDFMGEGPTPKIGASRDPRVGDKDRGAVIADQDGITDGLKSYFHVVPVLVLAPSSQGSNSEPPSSGPPLPYFLHKKGPR